MLRSRPMIYYVNGGMENKQLFNFEGIASMTLPRITALKTSHFSCFGTTFPRHENDLFSDTLLQSYVLAAQFQSSISLDLFRRRSYMSFVTAAC